MKWNLKPVVGLAIIGILGLAIAPNAQAASDGWVSTGKSSSANISGVVVTGGNSSEVDALVVHDNKSSGQSRVARVHYSASAQPTVKELSWPGTAPSDLEALGSVVGEAGKYIAVTSAGKAYEFTADDQKVTVLTTFSIPSKQSGAQIEGFDTALVNGKPVAIWAERGSSSVPARIYAASFNTSNSTFGSVSKVDFKAPYPGGSVRSASDSKLDTNGKVVVSSASDGGNSGPFDSAIYDIARVAVSADGNAMISLNSKPTELGRYSGHKIEGFAQIPGTSSALLGSDDESLGGALRTDVIF